jgi:hypothetical protein
MSFGFALTNSQTLKVSANARPKEKLRENCVFALTGLASLGHLSRAGGRGRGHAYRNIALVLGIQFLDSFINRATASRQISAVATL